MHRTLLLTVCAAVLLLAASGAGAQVPRATYHNPIAGFSVDIPTDWEMGSALPGTVLVALDGEQTSGVPYVQPVLWFAYSLLTPEALAANLARALGTLEGQTLAPHPTARPGEWELTFTSGQGGLERWLFRNENGHTYVIGALVRADLAPVFQADLDAALASCRLIARPAIKLFLEPTERAYSLVLPADW